MMEELIYFQDDFNIAREILMEKLSSSDRERLRCIAKTLGFTPETMKLKMAMMQASGGDYGSTSGKEGLIRSDRAARKQAIVNKKRKAGVSNDDHDDRDYEPPAMDDLAADYCFNTAKKKRSIRCAKTYTDSDSLSLSKEERLRREKPLKKPMVDESENPPLSLSKEERLRREKPLKKPMVDESDNPPLPLTWSKQRSLENGRFWAAIFNCYSHLPYKKRRICNGIPPLSEEDRLRIRKALKKPIPDDEAYPSLPIKAKKATGNGTKNNYTTAVPQTPPEIPIEVRNILTAMEGTDLKLVIQKQLFGSDCLPSEGRLSIPLRQIRETDFLTEEEKAELNTKQGNGVNKSEFKVELFEPNGNKCNLSLRKWDMKKESGANNGMYVLNSGWNKTVKDNNLKPNNMIQLWSFRHGSKLCFVLVKVGGQRNNNDGGKEGENSGTGGASTSQSKDPHEPDS